MIEFFVGGIAQPAGSKKAFGHYDGQSVKAWVVDANDKTQPWKDQVGWRAKIACRGRPLMLGAIKLTVTIYRMRPTGHFNASGAIKPSATKYPTTKPDSLKMTRAIEDAMTGIVYRDDSQICQHGIGKTYLSTKDGIPGVKIRVEEIP